MDFGSQFTLATPDGLKRSFSVSMDAWKKQDLLGHTSLNLLNSNQDPSFMRSVLYLDIDRFKTINDGSGQSLRRVAR